MSVHEPPKFFSIYAHRCAVADEPAVADMFEFVPDADRLIPKLHHQFTAQHWSHEFGVDFWIFGDGTRLVCLLFEGLDVRQAERVREKFQKRLKRAGGRGRLEWLAEILRQVVAPATLH